MLKTTLLTIVFLKTSLQRMQSKYYENEKKNKKVKRLLYFILFAVLAGVVGLFSSNIIDVLKDLNQETSFIGIILFLVLILSIIQSVFSSVNMLYFTKDTEYILPLPLKPYQIIIARTNVIIIVQYFIEIIVGLIPLIVYGFKMNCGPMFYVPVLISLILIPILPTLIISLIVMILMSFSKITKNKNKFQLFATFFVFVVTIALSIAILRMDAEAISDEQLAQMLNKANGMIDLIKGYFPTLKYFINAIISNNVLTMILELAKAIGITAIGYVIYALLAQKLYFKGLIGSLFSGEKKKNKKKIKLATKREGIGRRYVAKELKTLIRNPVYMVQCVLPAIILPILCIAFILISFDEEAINEIMQALSGLNANGLVMLTVIGITQFFSMIVSVSVTAISRDGQNAIFMKYIPVKYIKQIDYKVMPNIIMTSIMSIITVIIAEILIKVDILYLLLILITSIIMGVFQSYILIIVDLKKPKLEWNSEYAVVKQNMNLIWPAVIGLASITLLIILGIVFGNILNSFIFTGIIAFVYLLVTIITRNYINNNINKLMEKIY